VRLDEAFTDRVQDILVGVRCEVLVALKSIVMHSHRLLYSYRDVLVEILKGVLAGLVASVTVVDCAEYVVENAILIAHNLDLQAILVVLSSALKHFITLCAKN